MQPDLEVPMGMEAQAAQLTWNLNLLRPTRIFLICTCIAECLVVAPSVAAELVLEDDGPQVAICRACLFVARLSLLLVPLSTHFCRHRGERLQRRLDIWCLRVFGTACGSIEPSRGIATALAGWYLISTPMHDAFGPEGDEAQKEVISKAEANSKLLVPIAMIMAANVCLFLCDALLLTVAPLLRQGDGLPTQVHAFSYAQASVFKKSDADKEFSSSCVVCLSEFEEGEDVARLPCRHLFHTGCVSEWLTLHETCPLRCPGAVLPPLGAAEREEAAEEEAAPPPPPPLPRGAQRGVARPLRPASGQHDVERFPAEEPLGRPVSHGRGSGEPQTDLREAASTEGSGDGANQAVSLSDSLSTERLAEALHLEPGYEEMALPSAVHTDPETYGFTWSGHTELPVSPSSRRHGDREQAW